MKLRKNAPERLLITIAEAGALIGVKKSKAYQLAASGELPTVRIGSVRRVSVEALRAWVARKAE